MRDLTGAHGPALSPAPALGCASWTVPRLPRSWGFHVSMDTLPKFNSHTKASVKQPQARPEPSAPAGSGNSRFQKALPRTPVPARLAPAPWSRAGQPAAIVLGLRHGAWLRSILPLSVLFTERQGTARQTASVGHGGLVAKQSQPEAPARFCFCCACTLDT